MAGTNSLQRFLKKTPGTKKHKDKYKTKWRRYVAMVTPIAIMGFIAIGVTMAT